MPKLKGPKRSDRLIIRVYPEEKVRIENLAKSELKPVSDYIRERSLAGFTPEEGLAELNRQLEEFKLIEREKLKQEAKTQFDQNLKDTLRGWNFWKMLNEWRSANRGFEPKKELPNKP